MRRDGRKDRQDTAKLTVPFTNFANAHYCAVHKQYFSKFSHSELQMLCMSPLITLFKSSKFRPRRIWTLPWKALKDFLIRNVSAGNETSAIYGLGGPGLRSAVRPRHSSGDCSLAPNRGGLGSVLGLHTYLPTYLLHAAKSFLRS